MMDDLIKRQVAIDALDKEYRCTDHTDDWDGLKTAMLIIENLPSALPEVIRCNACRHWTQTTGEMCGFGLGNCDYHNAKFVNCNGFCYWAERRDDG